MCHPLNILFCKSVQAQSFVSDLLSDYDVSESDYCVVVHSELAL